MQEQVWCIMHPSSELPAALSTAGADAQRLAELLTHEFEVLKTRDIPALYSVQDEKTLLLTHLAQAAEWAATQTPPPLAWQQLQGLLQQCKQDHLRNIQLMQRQLQAVKGSLQALQGETIQAVDLYDRLGQVSRRHSVWSDWAA